MRIRFEGLAAGIEVPDSREFLATLRAAAPGWRFSRTDSRDEPVARVLAREAAYEIQSPGGDGSFVEATAVSAVCSVIVDVITSYIEENPTRLCLHCGSAVFGGRLVVFPSSSRAGKSTLIARLAAAGHEIYGDDVLPLDETDRNGIGLGLAPRPRIPLPPAASRSFKQFVDRHSGPADERYLYLELGQRLAARGASASLGAIVLLNRRPDGSAELGPAPRAETLKALITQNFARSEPADALLERLHRLMTRLPCLQLTYSDLDEAADLLQRTFSVWPLAVARNVAPETSGPSVHGLDTDVEGGPRRAPGKSSGGRQAPPLHARWRQNPSVRLVVVDGEAFLALADGEAIHHLNAVGNGLWNLLAEGIDQKEAIAVLHGAFPSVDARLIADDVAALFAALAEQGLIMPDADAVDD